MLSVASVIGRDFDLDLLARATKTTEDDLLDILDAAAAVALVRELADTGHYSFAHALIQHTLYEDLGPTRRARAHRRVAEALEDLCGDRPGARVGELARHWISATQPIDLAKAIGYSRQAGDAALGALAPADALRYYAQALDLYPQATDPDPVLGIDLAIGLGTAQRQTGDPAYRETLLDAARQAADLGDTERLVAAALANDRGYYSTASAIDTDKVEMLEMALDRLTTDNPDRALVLATLCSELPTGAHSNAGRPWPMRRWPSPSPRVTMPPSCACSITSPIPLRCLLLEQALAWTADALVRAERVGDPVLLFWAHSLASRGCCRGRGHRRDGPLHRDHRGSLAAQLDQPILSWIDTMHPCQASPDRRGYRPRRAVGD